jgi:GNAT superfamily N-acetyltransferase
VELTIREVAPGDQIRGRLAEFEKTVMKASYSAFMAPELVELLAEGRVVVPWLSNLHPQGAHLVAETGGEIAGTIDAHMPNAIGQCVVEPLMVRSNLQRQGVGARLWQVAEGRAAAWNARVIGAWSIVANNPARSFYIGRGCNPVSECDLVVGAETFKCEFVAKSVL